MNDTIEQKDKIQPLTLSVRTVFYNKDGSPLIGTVEGRIENGIGIHLKGLSNISTKEMLLRVAAAIGMNNYSLKGRKYTLNFLPEMRNFRVPSIDLAVATVLIKLMNHDSFKTGNDILIAGELGLNGEVRSIPMENVLLEAHKNGIKEFILPIQDNQDEISKDWNQYGISGLWAKHLADVIRYVSEK